MSWRMAAYTFSLRNDLCLILVMIYGERGRSIFCGIAISSRAGAILPVFVLIARVLDYLRDFFLDAARDAASCYFL